MSSTRPPIGPARTAARPVRPTTNGQLPTIAIKLVGNTQPLRATNDSPSRPYVGPHATGPPPLTQVPSLLVPTARPPRTPPPLASTITTTVQTASGRRQLSGRTTQPVLLSTVMAVRTPSPFRQPYGLRIARPETQRAPKPRQATKVPEGAHDIPGGRRFALVIAGVGNRPQPSCNIPVRSVLSRLPTPCAYGGVSVVPALPTKATP